MPCAALRIFILNTPHIRFTYTETTIQSHFEGAIIAGVHSADINAVIKKGFVLIALFTDAIRAQI